MDFFLTLFLYRRIAHRLTHIALERKRAPVVVAFYFLFQKHTRTHTHHLLIQVSYFRHIGEYAYTLDIHDTVGMENEDNISESWLDAHWAGTIDAFVIMYAINDEESFRIAKKLRAQVSNTSGDKVSCGLN